MRALYTILHRGRLRKNSRRRAETLLQAAAVASSTQTTTYFRLPGQQRRGAQHIANLTDYAGIIDPVFGNKQQLDKEVNPRHHGRRLRDGAGRGQGNGFGVLSVSVHDGPRVREMCRKGFETDRGGDQDTGIARHPVFGLRRGHCGAGA